MQDLFHQIVQHEMVAAGEGLDEAGDVLMSLHGKRGQLQAGDPALGAGFQRGDICLREIQPHHAVEELGGFGGGKAQIGDAQFGALPPGAQAGQRQVWIFARGDEQVHLRRLVFDEESQGLIDRLGIDRVVVIQDEQKVLRDGGNFVEQGGQNGFDLQRLGGLERSQQPLANSRLDRLQRFYQVRDEPRRIVIPLIQRQPGDRLPATCDPFADQRGFAKAGGGRDEGQFAAHCQPLVQPLDQARAEDNFRPRRGDVKFRG